MARNIGSWWIRSGYDGRRIEAQGFASLLDTIPGYDWTEDHGETGVIEKDFVETANYDEKIDKVDAVQMSSHGNPNGFAVSNGSVSTSDTIRFGKGDLEIFATHACKLLEHTASDSVARWIPAFDRLHYMCGFHTSSYSGGGQNPRGQYFAMYCAWYHAVFPWMAQYPVRDAWKQANILVEGSDVEWAYLRATAPGADTYNELLTPSEPRRPGHRPHLLDQARLVLRRHPSCHSRSATSPSRRVFPKSRRRCRSTRSSPRRSTSGRERSSASPTT